jgi:hypothetical protein
MAMSKAERPTDSPWDALVSVGPRCAACAKVHRGVVDLGMPYPDPWRGVPTPARNADLTGGSDVLTEDFCISEGSFFVRAVLSIPLIGTSETFAHGVWSTLSEKNFWKYVETFDSVEQDGLGPWFRWFAHRLKGHPDTAHLRCQVHPRPSRYRPRLEARAYRSRPQPRVARGDHFRAATRHLRPARTRPPAAHLVRAGARGRVHDAGGKRGPEK